MSGALQRLRELRQVAEPLLSQHLLHDSAAAGGAGAGGGSSVEEDAASLGMDAPATPCRLLSSRMPETLPVTPVWDPPGRQAVAAAFGSPAARGGDTSPYYSSVPLEPLPGPRQRSALKRLQVAAVSPPVTADAGPAPEADGHTGGGMAGTSSGARGSSRRADPRRAAGQQVLLTAQLARLEQLRTLRREGAALVAAMPDARIRAC